MVVCLCDCGNTTTTELSRLRLNAVKSCGCLRHEPPKSTIPASEIIGKRFGRGVVTKEVERRKIGGIERRAFKLFCDCGNEYTSLLSYLRSEEQKSCGCLQRVSKFIHGKTNSPEHRAWRAMTGRYCNPNRLGYENYGGRGIKVCERWRDSFVAFYEDVGKKPSPKHTLDRIDNDGDYEPGNCRWATRKEQGRNRRTCVSLEYNGRKLTIAEWAEETGLTYNTLQSRLGRLKWPICKALTTPLHKRAKNK